MVRIIGRADNHKLGLSSFSTLIRCLKCLIYIEKALMSETVYMSSCFDFQLPFMATGAAGALGLPVVELVGLAFAPEGGCVTIHVRGMVGKDVTEAAFKLNDARDANVDGTLRKY